MTDKLIVPVAARDALTLARVKARMIGVHLADARVACGEGDTCLYIEMLMESMRGITESLNRLHSMADHELVDRRAVPRG